MAVRELDHGVHRYIWDTSDVKPTATTHGVTTGSTGYDRQTGIMYITYDGTNWVEKDTIVRLEASASINIGDVELVDADGNTITYDEDTLHTTGDAGLASLGVRENVPAELVDNHDYVLSQQDRLGNTRVVVDGLPTFGDVSLMSFGNGKATWERGTPGSVSQRASSTGWTAKLTPGLQASYASAAMVVIPVNEMLITDFNAASWAYYLENAELHGVNIGFYAHDPTDLSIAIELNQAPSQGTLEKAAGHNQHQLDLSQGDQFWHQFVKGTDPGAGLTAGSENRHSFEDYQADTKLKDFTIYRIIISQGWYTTGTFDDCYIEDIILNGQRITLKPSKEEMWYSDHLIKNDIPISTSIYTPRRIHVKPVFANYSSSGTDEGGIGHLTRGGHGLANGVGGGIDLGEGYVAHLEARPGRSGTDITTFAFPVNIPVNKIDTLTHLERTQDNADQRPHISFRLDRDRAGAWRHDADTSDFYLVNYITASGTSSNTWKLRTPLLDTTWILRGWHSTANTPDGVITGGDGGKTFANFAATDIGDYYIKQVLFAYVGLEEGDWCKIASVVINGIEYVFDLADNQRIQHFYIKDTETSISETLFPQTPFRLLSLDFHDQDDIPKVTEDLTVTKTAGMGAYFNTVILTDELFVGSRQSEHYDFGQNSLHAADDKLVIAHPNGDGDDIGIDITYEIL